MSGPSLPPDAPLPSDDLRAAFDGAMDRPEAEREAWIHRRVAPDLRAQVLRLVAQAGGKGLHPLDVEQVADLLARASQADLPDGDALQGRRLADRYQLGPRIGQGGTAAVHAAEDRVTGDAVAVKLMPVTGPGVEALRQGEILALRLLRLPGVVTLRDDGEDQGLAYLVMDRVPGSPFPGTDATAWKDLARTTRSLLETLARIHDHGVIHGDLKPANVLVSAEGDPVILDLGIARDPGTDPEARRALALAGTPHYVSPEQIQGHPRSPQSDLYALGVMLDDTLSGASVGGVSTLAATHEAAHPDRIPLAARAPHVPPAVAALVDRMTAVDPGDRPPSARDALARLAGQATYEGPRSATWLGPPDLMTRLMAGARTGTAVDVCGPPGSGRTRLLQEVAGRLRAAGTAVICIRGRSRRDAPPATPTEREARGQALLDHVASGAVLLVDDAESLSETTARTVERARAVGCVIRSFCGDRPGAWRIPPLGPDDLRQLFHGLERVHRIPSDAADLLWTRSLGRPREVFQELAAWERAGLLAWTDGRGTITRGALERLRNGLRVGAPAPSQPSLSPEDLDVLRAVQALGRYAEPERVARVLRVSPTEAEGRLDHVRRENYVSAAHQGALTVLSPVPPMDDANQRAAFHARVAAALPAEDPPRLHHLLLSGDPEAAFRGATQLGEHLQAQGETRRAFAVWRTAAWSLRTTQDPHQEAVLLGHALVAALQGARIEDIEELLYLLGRAHSATPLHERIGAIARAARKVMERDPEGALRTLPSWSADVPDPVHQAHLSVWCYLCRQVGLERGVALLETIERSVDLPTGTPRPFALASAHAWLAYERGDYPQAARIQDEIAGASSHPSRRAAAQLNAASAWLEAGETEQALARIDAALAWAEGRRHATQIAGGQRLRRATRYRSGQDLTPDLALLEAIEALDFFNESGLACLNEAAVAWRGGDLPQGRALALRARAHWTRQERLEPGHVAHALAVACGEPDDTPAATVREILGGMDLITSRIQAGHLWCLGRSDLRGALDADLRRWARSIPRARWGDRREVLSIDDALQ